MKSNSKAENAKSGCGGSGGSDGGSSCGSGSNGGNGGSSSGVGLAVAMAVMVAAMVTKEVVAAAVTFWAPIETIGEGQLSPHRGGHGQEQLGRYSKAPLWGVRRGRG